VTEEPRVIPDGAENIAPAPAHADRERDLATMRAYHAERGLPRPGRLARLWEWFTRGGG
jgi:hypothetical protein